MDELNTAMDLAMEQYRQEFGNDAQLENGDEFATVFNDGVVIIGREGTAIKIQILAGKPYFVNHNLDLLETNSESHV